MGKLLIQGLFIGIMFGVPVGSIGALTLQRSFEYGFKAGFITGLGSTAADFFYALVGVFGISMIQGFVLRWQIPISILGGTILILMGILVLRKKSEFTMKEVSFKKYPVMFFSSFLIAICNPATILLFLAVFAMLPIDTGIHIFNQMGLVIGISLGTCIWWVALSATATKVRHSMADQVYQRLYKAMGTLLCIFGMAAIMSVIR